MQVGDEVICLDATAGPDDGPTGLTAGAKYRIRDTHRCCMGSYVDVGLSPDEGFVCLKCFGHVRGCGHRASRFIKLDPLLKDMTAEKEVSWQ